MLPARAFLLVALVAGPAHLAAQAAPPAPPAQPPAASKPAAPTAPASPAAPAAPAAPSEEELRAGNPSRDDALAFGRRVAGYVNLMFVDSLVGTVSKEFPTPPDLKNQLTESFSNLAMQVGAETKVTEERIMRIKGRLQYWRTAQYAAVPMPLTLRVLVGNDLKWLGIQVSNDEQLPAGEEVKP